MSDLTLAIETSNPGSGGGAAGGAGSVCLGHVDEAGLPVVVAHHVLSPASRHDDALMPAVARVCEEAGVKPTDLRRVAVSVGPGGFTSVRVAVTTAKMIAEATGAACHGVPTALALAHGALGEGVTGVLGVLLAWKREDVWRQRFRLVPHWAAGGAGLGAGARVLAIEDGVVVPLERASEGCDVVAADVELAGLLPGAARSASDTSRKPPRVIEPGFDAKWVLAASAGVPGVDAAVLVPMYPREPEAVTKWRALHPPRAAKGEPR